MKCTATATLQLLFFLTSSGSWNTQKAISSLEPSSDVDTVTAMGKSETSVGRRSSDEDDDDDDASCEWFSGFSVGERDRRSTFADRSRRSCNHLYVLVLWRIGSEFRAYVRTLCAQLAQTCADIMHVARFRDKIYLPAPIVPRCCRLGQCEWVPDPESDVGASYHRDLGIGRPSGGRRAILNCLNFNIARRRRCHEIDHPAHARSSPIR